MRAATRTAAAVNEGGNCMMGSSANACVASAKAHPAASFTASPSLRSTPSRCKYVCTSTHARHCPRLANSKYQQRSDLFHQLHQRQQRRLTAGSCLNTLGALCTIKQENLYEWSAPHCVVSRNDKRHQWMLMCQLRSDEHRHKSEATGTRGW